MTAIDTNLVSVTIPLVTETRHGNCTYLGSLCDAVSRNYRVMTPSASCQRLGSGERLGPMIFGHLSPPVSYCVALLGCRYFFWLLAPRRTWEY